MTAFRTTSQLLTSRSISGLQTQLAATARTQEQLATGKIINRPSDSPTGTVTAMRTRASLTAQAQFQRNAEDGVGRLAQADTALGSITDQVRRARELGLQGANTGAMSASSREALAAEVDQIRASIIGEANTAYLNRPVFGGITAGTKAYDASGAFVGTSGAMARTVADGVKVRVDVDGPGAFGPTGATVFDSLTALSAALRSGDTTALQAGLSAVGGATDRLIAARADVGVRTNQLEQSVQKAKDTTMTLKASLSEVESTDLAEAMTTLSMQQTAYQAALAATARSNQQSLLDFLR